MKHLIKKLVVLSLLVVMAISMVGCSSIPKDFKEAKGNLRDNDYFVEVLENCEESELSDLFFDAFYTLLNYDSEKFLSNKYKSLEEDLEDVKRADFDLIIACDDDDTANNIILLIFFEEKDSASEVYELTKSYLKDVKEEGFDKDIVDCERKDITYGLSGSVIYFGTKDALKATR